ncbi:MAG TPA: hypothetical protein DCL80_00950 [Balneola sp.]|jgi:acyl carrier protein|nr:hypothetical protein [Balneola sp.]MBR9916670.1 acyl carrier protein [bacterium]MAO78665.1 hypothetical protein [Balneola sp.]MBF63107.1 hypothetical protein [Balneola sp.]MBO6571706.1 acyl carrier protein [Balneola sp.]|tara:strand:+ start:31642 stop:31863 length:222 start_codon:yes stop_codon:yes gene_type:complete
MKVEDIIREVLYLDETTELSDEIGPGQLEAWDSLGHVNIITAIEDEYDIEISPEEIGQINSIAALKSIVQKRS